MTVAYPKGVEKALATNLVARTKALHKLLRKRLAEVVSRPGVTAAQVQAVIDATRRTQALLAPPKVSELMNTAMGVQGLVTRGVVDVVSKAVGRDLSQDLRLRVAQLQREAQQADWAQRVLAQQLRVERELFERLQRQARAALTQADQAHKVLEIADEQASQAEGRLRLLARHEVGNLVAETTQQTSQALGVRRYVWRSERDDRVRPLHRQLDGTIRSWDDPHPSEGHPGTTWGCRCTAQPVVDEASVPEPVKPPRSPERPVQPPVTPPTPAARPQTPAQPRTTPRRTRPVPAAPPPRAPTPIRIPELPPLPQLPPKPALPPVSTFAPQALPAFPTAGSVSPLAPVPVLAPPQPVPKLPELKIPKFPKVKRAPPLRDADTLLRRDYRVFTTRKAVEEYGAELAQKRQPLTREERAAVSEYTGFHYKPMNDALRAGRTHEYVAALDKAIDKAVIPHDIQVHRGIRSHPALADMRLVKVGDVFSDEGYQSTSLDRYGGFGGGILLHIKVPKGSKALWLDDISANQGEYEVLLARGSRLQITKIEEAGGQHHVECLLLPP